MISYFKPSELENENQTKNKKTQKTKHNAPPNKTTTTTKKNNKKQKRKNKL